MCVCYAYAKTGCTVYFGEIAKETRCAHGYRSGINLASTDRKTEKRLENTAYKNTMSKILGKTQAQDAHLQNSCQSRENKPLHQSNQSQPPTSTCPYRVSQSHLWKVGQGRKTPNRVASGHLKNGANASAPNGVAQHSQNSRRKRIIICK